eukprot:TRINITY_DN6285_c1_g1_i2.p1 TRINITY_DN6285_c1_g1~~TRINITY_DN6285_c1_g1_i2.p1  ORF type:complete len:702 (+),score=156.40 TRINITY_DN6285_c1_g1_i2:23-2128(+)
MEVSEVAKGEAPSITSPSKMSAHHRRSPSVDVTCPDFEAYEVCEGEEGTYYGIVLVQTSHCANGKHLILQLLKKKSASSYALWTHGARIGNSGRNSFQQFDNLQSAITAFHNKFLEKTGNQWSQRNNFKPVPGKYSLSAQQSSDNHTSSSYFPPPSSTTLNREPNNLVDDNDSQFRRKFPNGVELSQCIIDLLDSKRSQRQALAFDEITLEDRPSDFHPTDVNLHTFVTRNIVLKGCGIMSAAMDTVTERELALAMAKVGGIGILHRNLDPQTQSNMVRWVRRKIHYGGMIDQPITFGPEVRYSALQKEVSQNGYTFTSFPIVDQQGKLLGLLTRDCMDFVEESNPTLSEMMLPRNDVITAPIGTDFEQAYKLMKKHKIKKLLIVDTEDHLKGIFVWGDVKQDQRKRDLFSLDEEGHFLVGAAIGLGNEDIERAEMLVSNGCRLLVLDSSHGACKPAKDQIRKIREKFGNRVEILVGNIASYAAAEYLLKGPHKPDGLKVGIGPGSICTTRTVTGHGIPQVTAIYEVWRAVRDHGKDTGYYVPIVADGGIRSSGDIVKCLAVGASGLMMGNIFAGTDESPGKVVTSGGKRYKQIRGMGSRSAMEERSGSRVRYSREEKAHKTEELTSQQKQKLVPEGVEGLTEYRGSVEKVMTELLGGIQSGLAHSGADNVPDFRINANIWVQSFAGVAEGNPHNLISIHH